MGSIQLANMAMNFTPGSTVTLYARCGRTVLARPFFSKDTVGAPMTVDLITADGRHVETVDESAGVYQLDGVQFCLEPPRG